MREEVKYMYMRLRKAVCLLLVCVFSLGCLTVNAGAVQMETGANTLTIERASGRFSVDVSGKSTFTADSTFPLDIGDTVTITATYTPRSASVDFGLIAPDGAFYSMNASNGSFNETIKVDQRGSYTLAIRNNSGSTVSVSGTVNY